MAFRSTHWQRSKRRSHAHFQSLSCTNEDIPIRFVDVDLGIALQVAAELSIYAYDAYLIACARQAGAPLLTLDRGLARAACRMGVQVLEDS